MDSEFYVIALYFSTMRIAPKPTTKHLRRSFEKSTMGLQYRKDLNLSKHLNVIHQPSFSSLRRLATKYTFGAVDCILPTGMFLVSDVLNCICKTLVKNKVLLNSITLCQLKRVSAHRSENILFLTHDKAAVRARVALI